MKKYRENNKERIAKIREKYKNTHSRKIPDHLRKPRKPKLTEEEKKERIRIYQKTHRRQRTRKIKRVEEAPLPIVPKDLYLYKEFQNEKDFPKNYDGYCIKKGIPLFTPYPVTEYELRDLTGWIRHGD